MMMDRLPAELSSYIFELATTNDRQTACRLCLVSQSTYKIVSPLLYRHVCLSSLQQVKPFNTTLESSPDLGKLIHGMTLTDDDFAHLQKSLVSRALRLEAEGFNGWIEQWKTLIRHLGRLSREHSLSTLVLSSEVCRRIAVEHEEEGSDEVQFPLSDAVEESKLQLDHLVISHGNLWSFLSKVQCRRLTWYGCDLPIAGGALDPSDFDNVKPNQVEEVTFMIGDNHNHMYHPMSGGTGSEDGTIEDRDNRLWPSILVESIEELRKSQVTEPIISVKIHIKTQEARAQLITKLRGLPMSVEVDVWGRVTDTSHTVAELQDHLRHGWIEKTDSLYLMKPPAYYLGYKPIANGPPGNQWCGCWDEGYDSELDGEDEDDDDDDDDHP